MKKSMLFVAALAIMSCSSNELKKDLAQTANDVPFTFSAYSNNATKADTHNNLEFFYKTFKVYGWKSLDGKATWETTPVFDNVTNEYFATDAYGTSIYLENATDPKKPSEEWGLLQGTTPFPGWYYEGIRFWDKYATDYQFSAYTPITVSSEVACTPDGKILIGTSESPITVDTKNLVATPKTALEYTGFDKDYMTATSIAKTSAVNLVFSHELAKFNIKLVLSDAITTSDDVIVKEVSIKHIKGTSYYDSSKETATGYLTGWSNPTGDDLLYSVKGVNEGTAGYKMNGETAGTDNFSNYFVMERLMIPQTVEKNSVADQLAEMNKACIYVEYTIGNQTYKGHYALANLFLGTTSTETTYDFLGGNEYTLTINVGPLPIYFTTEVGKWTNHDASDLNAN